MPALRIRIAWLLALLTAVFAFLFYYQYGRTTTRHHAVPHDLEVAATVVGFPDEVRYFPRDTGDIKLITKEFVDSWDVEKAYLHTQDLPSASYLAISGGSDNGAF